MELTEEGLLEDGPRFGDGARLAELVRAIAYRVGLGDELAGGSRRRPRATDGRSSRCR
jgi:aldehyde:ferredoxin oxidoreductase